MEHNSIPSPFMPKHLTKEQCDQILEWTNMGSFCLILCDSELPCKDEATCQSHHTNIVGYKMSPDMSLGLMEDVLDQMEEGGNQIEHL